MAAGLPDDRMPIVHVDKDRVHTGDLQQSGADQAIVNGLAEGASETTTS